MFKKVILFLFMLCSMTTTVHAGLFSKAPKKDTAEVREARDVVAKWRNIVNRAKGKGDRITAPLQALKVDREVVNEALKAGVPDKDLEQSLKQTRILLNLAEVRQLTREIKKDIANFASYFNSRNRSQGAKKFAENYARLYELGKQFEDLLNRYPVLRTNTPTLLTGMVNSLNSAGNALEDLKRYQQCFKTPDKAYCARLASRRDQRFSDDEDRNFDGLDADEYDFDDEESSFDEFSR